MQPLTDQESDIFKLLSITVKLAAAVESLRLGKNEEATGLLKEAISRQSVLIEKFEAKLGLTDGKR